MIDRAALAIEEIAHHIAHAAEIDELVMQGRADEMADQRGRVPVDVAHADDGEIHGLGQGIDLIQTAVLDQAAAGLGAVDHQGRREEIACGVECPGQPPGEFHRIGEARFDRAAEQRHDPDAAVARRMETGQGGGEGAAPAHADGGVVLDRLREELAKREANRCGCLFRAALCRNHDDLVDAVVLLQRHGKFDQARLAVFDPDLHLAALAAFLQQADDRGAADAELLGHLVLGQAMAMVEPGGAQAERGIIREGRLGAAPELCHGQAPSALRYAAMRPFTCRADSICGRWPASAIPC